MKKIFLAFLFLLIAVGTSYGLDADSATVATLGEQDYGRAVVADRSELVTIWHDGEGVYSAGFGVSGTTATADGFSLVFYEDGQPITATRFGGVASPDLMYCVGATCGTVKQLVSLINSDTSGKFHAAIGQDASPGTVTNHILTGQDDLSGIVCVNEEDAISGGYVLYDDTSSSDRLLAGVRAKQGRTNRLKDVAHNLKGDANDATDGQSSYIKVYDDVTLVYEQVYDSTSYATATATTVSPGSSNGLSAHSGKSICVSVEKSEGATGTAEENANMSIVVGDWRP